MPRPRAGARFGGAEVTGFFWLHIKKSAGQTTRKALGPLYTETNRQQVVASIRDLPVAEWNDGLNNYRVPLGAYQLRRTEYARTVLWPDKWDGMMRVAFARHPVDRCLSMFSYLFDPRNAKYRAAYRAYLWRCSEVPLHRRIARLRAGGFDAFLDTLDWQARFRDGPDPDTPIGLHFSTHTNPMSLDVLDANGKSNLSHLIRLECFEAGIDLCYAEMGVARPETSRGIRRNKSRSDRPFAPSPAQRRRIEALYAADLDLYENALAL